MSGEYVSIHSEGGLLPPDLLARIVAGETALGGLTGSDYGLPDGTRPREEAARVWNRAKTFWVALSGAMEDLPRSDTGVSATREILLLPLLRALGYLDVEFRAAAEVLGERRFPISHRSGAVPLLLLSVKQDLDYAEAMGGTRRISPHALMQDYLNLSDASWGIVANGRRLRLLRNSAALTRQAYVDFDLEAMFEGGAYSDFSLMYLLLHRSRLPSGAGECWLDRWRANAESLGTRALGALRGGVEAAIRALGTGFLAHGTNERLRAGLENHADGATAYYASLLRLIYRLIFLFVAEERDLIYPPGASAADRERYNSHYAVTRLRDLALKYVADDRHDDLWRGLQVTFDLIAGRRSGLGIVPLGSALFEPDSLGLDGAQIMNDRLAEAVRQLSWVRVNNVTRRVNYRDMGAEELGGVYEGLLDHQPRIGTSEFHTSFELVTGDERKQTGSYYTPTPLVDELIRSALDPIIGNRLAGASDAAGRRRAILDITVCDPACGSGHFLLAAARRLAREVARIDAGDNEPSPGQFRVALREVIGRCVYGVDLNPLAVDLCHLALWLESHDPGRPLRFLDGQIKLGNSLVGVFDLDTVRTEGVPDGAYLPVTGDEKKAATYWKNVNKKARDGQATLGLDEVVARLVPFLAKELGALREQDDQTVDDVRTIAQIYAEIRGQGTAYWNWKNTCDLWTNAFFATLVPPEDGGLVPTTEIIWKSISHSQGIEQQIAAEAATHAHELHFFHWPLEFPTVFELGGFDCVLGNPPWERIKLAQKEFFTGRDTAIAKAPNKAAREQLIVDLEASEGGRNLYAAYQRALRGAEGESKFVRASGRFVLSAAGDVNTYALFTEHAWNITSAEGATALVIPTGIATDDQLKGFFQEIVDSRSLVELVGFENEEFIFPDVANVVRFCLFVLSGKGRAQLSARFAFYLRRSSQLAEGKRFFSLTSDDIRFLNPNTRTCPVFRTQEDANLTKQMYTRFGILVDERSSSNGWDVSFLRMLDMANDSGLFVSRPGDATLEPLYEAKMFWHFDHRFGSYDLKGILVGKGGRGLPLMPVERHQDPNYSVTPQYWVERADVEKRLPVSWNHQWLIGFRDVTSSKLERSAVFAFLPRTAVGHKAPLIFLGPSITPLLTTAFVANCNALVFDYLVRQKIGGTSLSYFILKQLPLPSSVSYLAEDLAFVGPRVLELTYTAWDLQPFAQDLGYDGPPFRWDDERRAVLRAELDAYYAALYGLTRDELRYILDPADVYGPDFPGETFRVLKERELREYKEYRTRRLVLEAWDRLRLEPRNRDRQYAVEGGPIATTQGNAKRPTKGVRATSTDWPVLQHALPGVSAGIQPSFGELEDLPNE